METFLKQNPEAILYEEDDPKYIRMQRISSDGKEIDIVTIPITKTHTIGDILPIFNVQHHRVVQLKDGIIRSIILPETKLCDLDCNKFQYRLDAKQIHRFPGDDPFPVCIRFVKQSPKERLSIPLLIDIPNKSSIYGLKLILFTILGMHDMNALNKFDLEIVGDWCKRVPGENPNEVDILLIRPDDPTVIPVILLNMNVNQTRKKNRLSYSYDIKWN